VSRTVPIEDIEPGDEVRNEEGWKRVEEINPDDGWVRLCGGNGEFIIAVRRGHTIACRPSDDGGEA
jgi:hypothetical protein